MGAVRQVVELGRRVRVETKTRTRQPLAEAVVVGRSFYGHDQLLQIELPSGLRLRSRRLGFPTWHPGDRVRIW